MWGFDGTLIHYGRGQKARTWKPFEIQVQKRQRDRKTERRIKERNNEINQASWSRNAFSWVTPARHSSPLSEIITGNDVLMITEPIGLILMVSRTQSKAQGISKYSHSGRSFYGISGIIKLTKRKIKCVGRIDAPNDWCESFPDQNDDLCPVYTPLDTDLHLSTDLYCILFQYIL